MQYTLMWHNSFFFPACSQVRMKREELEEAAQAADGLKAHLKAMLAAALPTSASGAAGVGTSAAAGAGTSAAAEKKEGATAGWMRLDATGTCSDE